MRTTWRPKTKNPLALGASMTPMIDVVFLLLIFFVCTTSFQPVENLVPGDLLISGAGLMDAPLEDQPKLERVVVRVQPVGYAVNETTCADGAALAELLVSLAQIDRTLPVVIDPESQVPLGRVIDAYDSARTAGFAEVKFAASVEK